MTSKRVEEHILPEAFIGTKRSIVSIHFGSSGSGKKAYIQAGLHADEAPGYLVADRLLQLLTEADNRGEITGEIILVPVANPIGLSQWNTDTVRGRFDDTNLINFNRQYPDVGEAVAEKIQGKLSSDADQNIALIRQAFREELAALTPGNEAATLKHQLLTLACDADIALDLHCDCQASVHIYTGTPLWPAARDLTAQLGAEATLLAEDSGDGPFDEACSKIWWELSAKFPNHPIPTACLSATVELRGTADTAPDQVEKDAMNLFIFLQRRGFVKGSCPEVPPLRHGATPLEGVDYIAAQDAGVLMYHKGPGDVIAKGDLIAELVKPAGVIGESTKVEIRSKTSGVLFARNSDRFARPGKIVAKVAGATPLAGKGKNLLTI